MVEMNFNVKAVGGIDVKNTYDLSKGVIREEGPPTGINIDVTIVVGVLRCKAEVKQAAAIKASKPSAFFVQQIPRNNCGICCLKKNRQIQLGIFPLARTKKIHNSFAAGLSGGSVNVFVCAVGFGRLVKFL